MTKIETKNAPEAIGPYSQAIVTGNLVYTSGQIPINPETGKIEAQDIEGQTHQSCKNVRALIEAAGLDMSSVVKTTCFLKNMGDFAAFNSVYEKYFTSSPARSCVEVAALPKGALVEIEAVAEK
ncbi:MAG: RidA family protein [Treponema sp.]|nr:RidA family protein [Treponema sp.]